MKSLPIVASVLKLDLNDPQFDLGGKYEYFGVNVPETYIIHNKPEIYGYWSRLVTYCAKYRVKPVAVFLRPNLELLEMCKVLGIVSIGSNLRFDFDKQVIGKDEAIWLKEFSTYQAIYCAETEIDSLTERLGTGFEGVLIPVTGELTNIVNPISPKVTDPLKHVKQLPKTTRDSAGAYDSFPLPEQFDRLEEPTLPLEMPDGMTQHVDEAQRNSDQYIESIKTRNTTNRLD